MEREASGPGQQRGRRLRWGVLGAARINRKIVPRLQESAGHRVVAIASRDRARAAACAAEWDIPAACDSYDALLSRDDVDAVYIPLPNAMHAAWTMRAAEAGKHVLCEKPLALSVSEVDAIAALARRYEVRVSEGFMYRHHPQTRRVCDLLAGGALGDVRLVRGSFTFLLDRPDDVRWQPELGGGALWDVGCYLVSYSRLVFGREPVEVFARATRHAGGVDESAAGVVDFGDGGVALLDCGFRAPFRASFEIVGTTGWLTVPAPFKPGVDARLVLVRSQATEEVRVTGETVDTGEFDDMARQVFDGAPAVIPLADSRANAAVLAALHRSTAERRAVSLTEVA